MLAGGVFGKVWRNNLMEELQKKENPKKKIVKSSRFEEKVEPVNPGVRLLHQHRGQWDRVHQHYHCCPLSLSEAENGEYFMTVAAAASLLRSRRKSATALTFTWIILKGWIKK